jgi:hypothetical protein
MDSDDIKKEKNIHGVEITQKPKKSIRKILILTIIVVVVGFIGFKIIGNIKIPFLEKNRMNLRRLKL